MTDKAMVTDEMLTTAHRVHYEASAVSTTPMLAVLQAVAPMILKAARQTVPGDVGELVKQLRNEAPRNLTKVVTSDQWVRPAEVIVRAADSLEAQAAEIEAIKSAARSALGCLDDPTGGEHVADMRRAAEFLRAALKGASQ